MQMTSLRDSEEAKARRTSLRARKIAQADEGRLAMADYEQKQQATLDRTVKLKSLRLAQEAVIVLLDPPKPSRVRKKKSASVPSLVTGPPILKNSVILWRTGARDRERAVALQPEPRHQRRHSMDRRGRLTIFGSKSNMAAQRERRTGTATAERYLELAKEAKQRPN